MPTFDEARSPLSRFQAMVRERRQDHDTWTETAARSLLMSFVNGIRKNRKSCPAALTELWSNGQLDGQIIHLKLVNRQMFGRAKLDLFEARLIDADCIGSTPVPLGF
ncbi:hypothetical protein DA075_18785 [Methylobacterium currus]|uniref:Uncharacterized protein n=1 Tax=Methylobacterium currus TaxID=2051553 RepID=A0A2R4WME5_9HYPH|nr:hypothetical protein DA075_18785 [Methylobacterium currus]